MQQATQLVSHQQEARSAVERIGAFAAVARAQQLKPNVRQLFKRNILDLPHLVKMAGELGPTST